MRSLPFDLTKRTAVVTGGGKGIGKGICLALAQLGANVVIAGRDIAMISQAAQEIGSRGGQSLAVQTDVCNREQVERLVQRAVEIFGRIDILVNNAGGIMSSQMVPALEMSESVWDYVVNLNMKSVFFCCQTAAREMMKQKKGNIINISSISGIQSYPMCVPYGASKAAVNSLTLSLATILGPHNIRVNAVVPGAITSGAGLQLAQEQPELVEQRKQSIPLGRLGSPEDVGWAVAYLASDASDYVTGQLLGVDGAIPKSPNLASQDTTGRGM